MYLPTHPNTPTPFPLTYAIQHVGHDSFPSEVCANAADAGRCCRIRPRCVAGFATSFCGQIGGAMAEGRENDEKFMATAARPRLATGRTNIQDDMIHMLEGAVKLQDSVTHIDQQCAGDSRAALAEMKPP